MQTVRLRGTKRREKMTESNPCYGCEGLHFKADHPFEIKNYYQYGKLVNRQSLQIEAKKKNVRHCIDNSKI